LAAIAIFNSKGGVGKTTLAVNLAWESANAGNRTLLWDLDGQGDSTAILIQGTNQPQLDAAGLMHGTADINAFILPSKIDRLDVLVPEAEMRRTDNLFVHLAQQQRLNRLFVTLKERYDRIIIDCPPGFSDTARRLLVSVDLIVVPVVPAPLAFRGLERVRSFVTQKRGRHAPILPVFSMVDRRRTLHKAGLADHPDWPVIPMSSAVEQMTCRQMPVGAIAPDGLAAQVFRKLWAGVDHKLRQMRLARNVGQSALPQTIKPPSGGKPFAGLYRVR
jgi:chromosome partitioning protein